MDSVYFNSFNIQSTELGVKFLLRNYLEKFHN